MSLYNSVEELKGVCVCVCLYNCGRTEGSVCVCLFITVWKNGRECVCWSLSRVGLCDPMDCNLPGFSVPGILQAWTETPGRLESWPLYNSVEG